MLFPKKVKFRKVQRGRMKGLSKGAKDFYFGDYGLRALEPAWVTSQQIESMRVALNKEVKKIGKVFLRIFPDKPVSKKPAETRMGKGKGNPEFWVAVVKRERIICEIAGVDEKLAKKVLRSAAYKLPMKTKIEKRIDTITIEKQKDADNAKK